MDSTHSMFTYTAWDPAFLSSIYPVTWDTYVDGMTLQKQVGKAWVVTQVRILIILIILITIVTHHTSYIYSLTLATVHIRTNTIITAAHMKKKESENPTIPSSRLALFCVARVCLMNSFILESLTRIWISRF